MRRDSIFFSITLFFGVAMISVFMLFSLLIEVEYDSYRAQNFKRYAVVERILTIGLRQGVDVAMLDEQVRSVNFTILKDFTRIKDITDVSRHMTSTSEILILSGKEHRFIKLETGQGSFLLEDMEPGMHFPLRLYGSLAASLLILVAVYLTVVNKLRPLSRLRLKIRRFAEGDKTVSTALDTRDEIADVANEFDRLVKKLGALDDSRKLFLRNIMHELKTPLTKGRLVSEMLPESKNKSRLVEVFARIDQLIDQLGKIEQLTAGYLELKKTAYRFIDILEHVQDLLMVERTCIDINRSDSLLDVDYELFSLAVKNLVDNGIKYSPDRRVTIDIREEGIFFISKGECLKEELEFYTRPFSRDQTNTKQGMGLGLYIVREILEKHGFALRYRCEEGANLFIIVLDPQG